MGEDVLDRIAHITVGPNIGGSLATLEGSHEVPPQAVEALQKFWFRLFEFYHEAASSLGEPLALATPAPNITEKTYAMLIPYALTFMRKASILLHVRYGVDFPDAGFADMDKSELDRLTKTLRLPSLPEMLASVGDSLSSGLTVTQAVVSGWVRHWYWTATKPGSIKQDYEFTPSHPAIFELIGLPKNYDALTHEAMRRRCPTTGKELVDPALCLFCGDIFCSQAICCHKNNKGGCFQHMKK